mgnify:CR=1 FL=1
MDVGQLGAEPLEGPAGVGGHAALGDTVADEITLFPAHARVTRALPGQHLEGPSLKGDNMPVTRTTHRSSSGKKLYAVRDAKGRFQLGLGILAAAYPVLSAL